MDCKLNFILILSVLTLGICFWFDNVIIMKIDDYQDNMSKACGYVLGNE